MIDVIEIMFHPLFNFFARIGFAAPAVDLCPAGNSGAHPVAREITIDHLFVKRVCGLRLGGMRARSNK
jgi:hypothetical protein